MVPGEHIAINFGSASTGAAAGSRVLHVNNLGTVPLTVALTAPRQFAITESTCGALAARAACDLTVQYTPLTGGDVTGTVFLQGTLSDGSATRDGLGYVEGYGVGNGSLAITGNLSNAGLLSFGQVTSGQTAKQILTLTNPQSAPAGTVITVRRIRSESPFLSTTDCGQPLARGQSCSVTLTYAPVYQVVASSSLVAPRQDAGSLSIESDAANAPQFVDLSGQAGAVVVASAGDPPPVFAYSLSQGSLTFGRVSVGTASAGQSVQVSNTGTATLHIAKLIASSGFAVTSNCAALPAGATCSASVSYQPQSSGTTLGSLEIQSDSSASLDFVSLLGAGDAASVALTPQSLDFGRVLVGRSSTLSATLANTGATPVTLGTVSLPGADFALAASTNATNACPAAGGSLAPGNSCTIAVVFAPTTAGTLRATLSVATSATTLPLTVALSGVGTQPALIAAPSALNFGNVAVGSSSTLSLTLSNVSTAPVDGLVFAATKDFSVSTTCGITTVNAGSSCSVSVTYTPSAIGAATGTLTISSNDPASPILVPLTGTAVQGGSFLLTVNGGPSASVTVQAGLPATYSLSLTPTGGYSGVVALTCSPDAPVAYATCSLLPATLTLTTGSQASTVTITTVTASTTAQVRANGASTLLLCFLPLAAITLVSLRKRSVPLLALVLLAGTVLGGCGGGGDSRIRYVAPGTYSFHVTATSTNGIPASQTVALTLVVIPRT